MDSRIKLLVIGNHTLAYQFPGRETAQVLNTSILKGSPYHDYQILYPSDLKKARLASKEDFDSIGEHFSEESGKGFNNDKEYEFKK